jgi:hypothetical protein
MRPTKYRFIMQRQNPNFLGMHLFGRISQEDTTNINKISLTYRCFTGTSEFFHIYFKSAILTLPYTWPKPQLLANANHEMDP